MNLEYQKLVKLLYYHKNTSIAITDLDPLFQNNKIIDSCYDTNNLNRIDFSSILNWMYKSHGIEGLIQGGLILMEINRELSSHLSYQGIAHSLSEVDKIPDIHYLEFFNFELENFNFFQNCKKFLNNESKKIPEFPKFENKNSIFEFLEEAESFFHISILKFITIDIINNNKSFDSDDSILLEILHDNLHNFYQGYENLHSEFIRQVNWVCKDLIYFSIFDFIRIFYSKLDLDSPSPSPEFLNLRQQIFSALVFRWVEIFQSKFAYSLTKCLAN